MINYFRSIKRFLAFFSVGRFCCLCNRAPGWGGLRLSPLSGQGQAPRHRAAAGEFIFEPTRRTRPTPPFLFPSPFPIEGPVISSDPRHQTNHCRCRLFLPSPSPPPPSEFRCMDRARSRQKYCFQGVFFSWRSPIITLFGYWRLRENINWPS